MDWLPWSKEHWIAVIFYGTVLTIQAKRRLFAVLWLKDYYLECGLECLNTFHCGSQTFLKLGHFAAQVGIVTHQLLVHFRQLFQIVLQEWNLLLLCEWAALLFRTLLWIVGFLYPCLWKLYIFIQGIIFSISLIYNKHTRKVRNIIFQI